MKNYYEILGVAPDCTQDEIKKAYRKLARSYHPDTCGGGDSSRFRSVQEAYENIGDSEKRAAYDRQLNAENTQSFAATGQSDRSASTAFDTALSFADYFHELLTHWMSNAADVAFWGEEVHHIDLILTPMEAQTGGTVAIELPLTTTCPFCHGRGWYLWSVCDRCQGTGYVRRTSTLNLKFQPLLRDRSLHEIYIPGYGIIKIRVIIS
ncbi:MAG: DnaJ domain-containing protein [candidate division KSB1 bacterium]|nr:DnaJ domain-containing protein [candidate division KSB1 bacterium]MDZ7341225.1 DnaJ domain-containing protein [candidate division KSB1 bacterium]